ncbi:MAG: pyrimidine 5'-nucleotidase [Burkholderiales bacterium]
MRQRATWIFDLDNTLHDARPHIMPHINRSMTEYLQRHLKLDEPEAAALRMRYWHRYGATLVGMMRNHGTDPRHFLLETHRFPELERMVVAESGLRHALRRLPGSKIVFSNAPLHYVNAVLAVLRIGEFFDALYSIEHTRFRPKPEAAGFLRLLRSEQLAPELCVLVEDALENLRAAKRLGMKTVWVTRESRAPRWLDAKVPSVLALPRLTRALGLNW